MINQHESLGVPLSSKARWLYCMRWLMVTVGVGIIATILLIVGLNLGLESFLRLGLLQPGIAAIISLTVVLSMRLIWGRFVNESRKGVNSASSAAIAVRLWAMCFALLVSAMLLSALIARLPNDLLARTDRDAKRVEVHVELKGADGAPAARTSLEVRR